MFKIIWDKLNDILGDKTILIIFGIIIAIYGYYCINKYLVTRAIFAQEKVKIENKIETVDIKSCRGDMLIKYKIIRMDIASIEQQQWALEDQIDKQQGQATRQQELRLQKMERRLNGLKTEEKEIQKGLEK